METKPVEGFVIKFDYNLETLQQIAREADSIDLTNLELVKETHKKLVKIRTTIKRQEKEMVDEANSFRTRVFSKRDEYLSITEPVETKLKNTLELEEQRKIMEARVVLLPNKKEQLALLDIIPVIDEFLLSLNETGWVMFYQSKIQENHTNILNKKRIEQEAQERIARETRIKKETEERAELDKQKLLEQVEIDKKQALLKAEEDKKQAVFKLEQEAQTKLENEKKTKELKEKQELEAKTKAEANLKYQNFLKDNNFNKDTDKIERNGSEFKIYRLIATTIITLN